MVTRTVTIDDVDYLLKPLTRREFKGLQPPDETTLEKALALSLHPDAAEKLEGQPVYVSKMLFDELIDLTYGGKAVKNL